MMKKYSIVVEGKNVYLNRGQIERMGFFTTRWVEARNKQEAKKIAIEHIEHELATLEILCNSPKDPPILVVDKTQEVDSFGDNIVPGKGFTFYKDENATGNDKGPGSK